MPRAGEGRSSPIPFSLQQVLDDARRAGFLGPGPIEQHVRHAAGFTIAAERLASAGPPAPLLVDLGSGGGVPGLVVAELWPEARVVLLEANGRRASFLNRAVARLDLGGRVQVVQARAELSGRNPDLRSSFDGAMARSFGRPAVVAECAAPLLKVGGWLIVSEPPSDSHEDQRLPRWPAEPLADLGLEPVGQIREAFEYQELRQRTLCPERFPRRDGMPAKRPLF